jgi:FkbM family methyltransferase
MTSRKLKWDANLYQDNSSFQYNLALMAIKRLKPLRDEKILDIGCGNALSTIELAKHIPGGQIIAIEVSPDMCKKALDNIKKSKITNISVIKQDAFTINYKNEFDAVFSNSAIHWIYDLETMYKKIYMALKNNGRIIVQTALKGNNTLIDTAYKLVKIPEFREYFNNLKLPWRFLSEDENRKILKVCNYKNITIEPYLYKFSFNDLNSVKDYFKSAALIPFLSVLPEEHHENITDKFLELYFNLKMSDNLEVQMYRVFIQAEKGN